MTQQHKIENELEKIYFNPPLPGSYGGVKSLYRTAKSNNVPNITEAKVRQFLAKQRAYTIHKPIRHKYQRNKTYVSGIDKQWQADLADMKSLAKWNDGVTYILTVIDVFSKHAWAYPVKNKGTQQVLNAFENILLESQPRKPIRLQTDQGKEFVNKVFQA